MDHLIQYCNEPASISRLRDNQFLEVNDAFVEITGYRREEVRGRTALELGLWESAELYADIGRRLADVGAVKELRTTFRTRSGEIRQCIFSAVLREVDGEPCCISFISDITERIRKDERLRATEHRLRYIISHAPVVVNEFDTDGIMTMSEGSAVPHARFGPSAIGRSMLEVFAESPAVGNAVERVLAGNTVNETLELDGRWFEVWAEPIRRPDHTIIGGMAVSTDITARVLAEQSLAAEKDQFRMLVDNSTDIVLLAERSGGIRFVNPAVAIQTGYSPGEFIGGTGFSKIHPDDVADVIKSIDSAFVYPGLMVGFRFRLRTKTGEFRMFEATGKVLPGYPDRIVIQERDITARETYEAELKLARDAAISSARLQSAFVANISHEVRTPLNVILGYLDVVAEHLSELGDSSQNEYLESAARAGQRLTETITNILDYSKIEAGLFQHHCQPLRLADFVASHVEQFRAACAQKRVELRFLDETTDAVVLADEYCLSVAIRNLLDNAIKFTDRGAITVRQFVAGTEVGLEIKDSGVGMEAIFLAKLFKPFIQEDTGFTRSFEGSGLGLALTKRLLEACDGRITAQSEKATGSVFTIYLPGLGSLAGDRRTPESQSRRTAHFPGLLLVEDDPPTQKMMRVLLHDTYTVRVAADLAGVKKEIEASDPPITAVLMDISLRGSESGLDIARFLRATAAGRNLSIVALTAHTSPEHHRMALEAGCDAVLTKPVVRDQILEALTKASNGRHPFSVI